MRINQFVAQATGIGRRAADTVIAEGRVTINGTIAKLGDTVGENDIIQMDKQRIRPKPQRLIMFNKPVGYVCSRNGQGSKTIYELLPQELQNLKPIGRLDKDSSGLLLLTNDGKLANQLAHPSFQKKKIYEVTLDKPLTQIDKEQIEQGIPLDDGPSRLLLEGQGQKWIVTMHEGRNRQVRRTFKALGYTVAALHRTTFGPYRLTDLGTGKYKRLIV